MRCPFDPAKARVRYELRVPERGRESVMTEDDMESGSKGVSETGVEIGTRTPGGGVTDVATGAVAGTTVGVRKDEVRVRPWPRETQDAAGLGRELALVAGIVAVFVGTRWAAFGAGMRYRVGEAAWLWQLLDLGLLRDHLLRSLWYLHGQPPLFNAVVGVAEKIAGARFGEVMLGLQLVLGLGAVLAVNRALGMLRVGIGLRAVVCVALLLNPVEITFEFDALYTEIAYALHCFLALAVVRFLKSRTQRELWGVAALAVALTLVRSTYQWVWVAAVFAVLWGMVAERRREIRWAGVVAVGLAMVWPAKNLFLVGHFTSSTWAASSMAKHWSVNDARVQEFEWAGLIETFPSGVKSRESSQSWLGERWQTAGRGVPELDALGKEEGGATNWNSLAMLRMHEAQAKDVGFLLRHDPKPYVVGVVRAVLLYFQDSADYFREVTVEDTVANFRRVEGVDQRLRRVCCNVFGVPGDSAAARPGLVGHAEGVVGWMCLGAVAVYGFVVGCGPMLARRTAWLGDQDRRVAVVGMIVTVGYVFVVSNLLDVGENMRFRLETQPLMLMAAAILVAQIWDRRKTVRG